MISFDVTPADQRLIDQIADRAMAIAKTHRRHLRKLDVVMDLTATHANGCPLDLQRLLDADDFNLAHDVYGIERHLNRDDGSRTGGQLLNQFLPRFAAKAQGALPSDSAIVRQGIADKRAQRGG